MGNRETGEKLDSHASTKTALMGNGLPRGVMMRQILRGSILWQSVVDGGGDEVQEETGSCRWRRIGGAYVDMY